MSNEEPLMVDCGPHGKRVAAVVCRHLLDETSRQLGFVENSSDPDDLQAWCADCEEKFLSEGDMTEAFRDFSKISIVCVVCYAEIKERHTGVTH